MGLERIFERCTEPKETNRQIDPMFRRWLRKGGLGILPVPLDAFMSGTQDAVLDASDAEMLDFARSALGYERDKGLDFIARFNGKYVIGEAKFLTEFGGNQDNQFEDAIDTLEAKANATKIAILDGILYIKNCRRKICKILNERPDYNIMSALLLREFLYQL